MAKIGAANRDVSRKFIPSPGNERKTANIIQAINRRRRSPMPDETPQVTLSSLRKTHFPKIVQSACERANAPQICQRCCAIAMHPGIIDWAQCIFARIRCDAAMRSARAVCFLLGWRERVRDSGSAQRPAVFVDAHPGFRAASSRSRFAGNAQAPHHSAGRRLYPCLRPPPVSRDRPWPGRSRTRRGHRRVRRRNSDSDATVIAAASFGETIIRTDGAPAWRRR